MSHAAVSVLAVRPLDVELNNADGVDLHCGHHVVARVFCRRDPVAPVLPSFFESSHAIVESARYGLDDTAKALIFALNLRDELAALIPVLERSQQISSHYINSLHGLLFAAGWKP